MSRRAHRAGRGGFSLPEVLVASAILLVVGAAVTAALARARGLAVTGGELAALEEGSARALHRMVGDLRRSGFVGIGGVSYPHLFDDGNALPPFDAHAHPPATKQAVAGDPDFGPNREIVFLLPADDDGDGIPDVDATGHLVWGGDEVSYVVVTGADGVNVLERRTNGTSPLSVARNVERIAFDDPASSGFQVPLGTVRVRLFFRDRDSEGRAYRHAREFLVRLRNGESS
ncbi:MAG TPA: prepilin-type N-terminal cleavage/methylation domain-containing protein [Planctomycetota bacterium]|jgi:prepilin-type N-terminal cleavage/methylation domain-containing protein|nr:prepilin-type N-terminal cleavage/methylation domain-containing protein [Planctomycetota bacterium]